MRAVRQAIRVGRPSAKPSAQPYGRETVRLQNVRKVVRLEAGNGAARSTAYGRQAVGLSEMRQTFRVVAFAEEAYACARCEATARVREVQQIVYELGVFEAALSEGAASDWVNGPLS